MTNYLLYNYYYRYRQKRKLIKDIVDTANYVQAQTDLNQLIAEHQAKFPDSDTRKDFNFGEKLMMVHALAHTDTVIENTDTEFVIVDDHLTPIGTGHQSDIIKEILLRVPKSQY